MSSQPTQTCAPAAAPAAEKKPKSWWKKLKEENTERKKNSVVYSSAEATRITGYNDAGRAATQARKDEQKLWETGEKSVGTRKVFATMLPLRGLKMIGE